MALNLTQLTVEFRDHLGDVTSDIWSDAQLQSALNRAIRAAWPYFFDHQVDNTTYVGSGARVANTLEVPVPNLFLPGGSGLTSRPAGKISYLEVRMWDGSTSSSPVPARWFGLTLHQGVTIDPLDRLSPVPKIKFNEPYSQAFEMRVYGGTPITPADVTIPAQVIPSTDYNGFLEFLMWKGEEFARSERLKTNALDRRAHSQRRLLAADNAKQTAMRYRMRMYEG